MHTFTDTAGRSWEIAVTIGAVKRVKGLIEGVDLLAIEQGEPPLIQRLYQDWALLVDVLFAVLKPKAETLGVTDLQFAESLGGPAALAARSAFMEDLQDFFRGLGQPGLALVIEKMGATAEAEAALKLTAYETISPLIQEQVERAKIGIKDELPTAVRKAVGNGRMFTSSPDSLASTPSR